MTQKVPKTRKWKTLSANTVMQANTWPQGWYPIQRKAVLLLLCCQISHLTPQNKGSAIKNRKISIFFRTFWIVNLQKIIKNIIKASYIPTNSFLSMPTWELVSNDWVSLKKVIRQIILQQDGANYYFMDETFKWKLSSSTFMWYCLLCCTRWF